MFQDVESYAEYLARVVARCQGECEGSGLLGVAEYAAATFGRLGEVRSVFGHGGLCVDCKCLNKRQLLVGASVVSRGSDGEGDVGRGGEEDGDCAPRSSSGPFEGGSGVGSAGVGLAGDGQRRSAEGGVGGERAGCGERSESVGGTATVKASTVANREKRRRRKEAKLRKQAEEAKVPEWRRNGGVGFHKGVFSECSSDTQLALRESRAQMLIAKNKAAVIEAEERARKTAAMLKSRMIEENVEKDRLELEKKMKSLRESTALPQGYCETVLSALATPSLSDGTVSPDSSISSAEVHKKDEAIRMLVGQCDEQRKETDKFKLKHQETEQRLLATIKRLEALETSTTAARKAREEAARERVRREREEMFSGKQAGEGWAGVRGARNVGKTEHNIDGTTKIVWSTDAEV